MAEAVIGAVAEEAVGGCINQIKHHFNYLAHYHENMENLKNKLQILETKRAEVQVKVSSATDKGETIMDNVQKWLGEVDGKKKEAEDILKDKERVGNGCWRGWFLNVNLRYRLSKKAMKKSADLDTFLARGEFEIVAHPKRPLAHVYDSSGANSSKKMKSTINHQVLEVQGNEGSTSEMSAAGADGGLTSRSVFLNNVMAAVRDPKIRIIRICGMGGIGKTTLVKQVEQRARAERLFNEIAMVEVNQNPDIKILQLHIAELFGLELKEDSVPARAKRLSDRLNAKDQKGENRRILLILDNVWKKEGLEEAGIPLTEEKSLCKILLTSRSVLVCKDIAPEPEFNIGVLSHPESLILFCQCFPKEPPFYDEKMAEKLVEECGGLPISITAIAKAVAYKSQESWTNALAKLRKSEFEGEYGQVLNSLKVSYDFLETEEIKRFFRLFCFFKKGSDVLIEDLARYGMALGCFTNSEKLYDARNEAHSYAETLLQSSLLLHGDKESTVKCFKVHDIVWDLAVQVPSNDLFIINHGDELKRSKRREPNQNYTSMSLQCNEMVDVPKGVDSQNLKFLQLIGNSDTLPLKFLNTIYEEMHELNVLAFRSLNITSLPKSLQLRNLVSLSFDRCTINSDISMIGNLLKLELLSFACSDIQKLPIEIASLEELRLLDMTGCEKLLVIAPYVLSKLSSLEELYMRGTPLQLWSGSPTLSSDIKSMSKLVVLHITMPPVEVPRMDSMFTKLQCFKISVWASERWETNEFLSENCLDLECDSTVLQQHGVKLLLHETVRMDLKVTNLKNLFPLNDSEVENFSNLKNLSIESCNEMNYLVNMVGYPDKISVFQNLVSLRLCKLPRLEEIFHVWSCSESFVAPFCNLKVLKVVQCNELKHLFSSSEARSLNRLEVIEVKSCNKLKVVFGKGRGGEEKIELRNLKNVTLESLPNLVGWCSDVDAPEFPQLEELKIDDLPLITSIIEEESVSFDSSHSDDSSSHPLFSYKGRHTSCKFQNLKELVVRFCDSLRHLFTTSIAISFPELQNLEVVWCKSLITIIAEEGIKEEKDKRSATEVMLLFPKLKVLYLIGLISLSTFLPKGYTLTWSSLKILTLAWCGGEWNTLFPIKNNIQGGTITSVTTAANKLVLTSLEELSFTKMNTLSGFWYDYFPSGFSYELRKFQVVSSEQSIMFSPHMIREFQHLTNIRLSSCKSLEVVFDLEEKCNVEEVGSKLPALNKLDYLFIDDLPKLVNVWKKVPENFQGFGNLDYLCVNSCDSLKYLFVPSIAKCLVKLRRMDIGNCKVMEEVVSMRDEEGGLTEDKSLFPQLQELFLTKLPSLKYLENPQLLTASSVNAINATASNSIFGQESIDPTMPGLVRLEGIVCPWPWSFHKLKSIEVKRCNNLSSIFPPDRVVRLPALEQISVANCENLQYIFSSSTATSLEQLTELTIERCNMTEVIRKDEEEEDVDGRIKFVHLESIKLDNLPNLEGICLGMVTIDWPLLRSVNISGCSKMRMFTSGYSNTPLLNHLTINEDVYDPTVEGGDVNTVLRNAQKKDTNFLALLGKEGIRTINGFHLAGEYLIAHYSRWSWESSYEKSEQYLIARNVPCFTKPRNNTSIVENEVDHGDNDGEDDKNIYKPRTYDVSITRKYSVFDHGYESTYFWLKGYDDESKTDLPLDLVFQDINMEYLQKSHVTPEYHPYLWDQRVSLFPREQSRSIVKKLITNLLERGFHPSVENHLKLFVDELFPTFQFDPPR